MIQNKKLFFIGIASISLWCFGVVVPIVLSRALIIGTLRCSVFYMINSLVGFVLYTLIYKSLKKTDIVKKIYRFMLFIAIMVFIIGIVTLFVPI